MGHTVCNCNMQTFARHYKCTYSTDSDQIKFYSYICCMLMDLDLTGSAAMFVTTIQ